MIFSIAGKEHNCLDKSFVDRKYSDGIEFKGIKDSLRYLLLTSRPLRLDLNEKLSSIMFRTKVGFEVS